jgi:hypothetical protein
MGCEPLARVRDRGERCSPARRPGRTVGCDGRRELPGFALLSSVLASEALQCAAVCRVQARDLFGEVAQGDVAVLGDKLLDLGAGSKAQVLVTLERRR